MKKTTIQLEILSPPEKYFLLPQEWRGKVKFQYDDIVYDDYFGWKVSEIGEVWKDQIAAARLRPHNPQGLSDEILLKLPIEARFLSKEEDERIKQLDGLKKKDEKLLSWNVNEWECGNFGDSPSLTYATFHPTNYYLQLDDSAFVKGEQKLEPPTPPEGYELVTAPNDTCKEGDMVWTDKWEKAVGYIGVPISECVGETAFIARPKAKPASTPPAGFELVKDPDYICQEGDMVWCKYCNRWETAEKMVGQKVTKNNPYIATPTAKQKSKFKVGDKVFYDMSSAVWTVESIVSKDDKYHYNIKDTNRGKLGVAYEWLLRPAKLAPWTFKSRPAEALFFRRKGLTQCALLALAWSPVTVLFVGGEEPTYKDLLANYEWSPDGKDNWQPCGIYVEA